MKRPLVGIVVIALVCAFFIVFYILNKKETSDTDSAKTPGTAKVEETSKPSPRADAPGKEPRVAKAAPGHLPRLDEAGKKARAETLKLILQALTERGGDKPEARTLSMDPAKATPSDQELLKYVGGPIREIRPILRGCYLRALDDNRSLSGIVKVKFSIVGDAEHGGLVETTGIAEEGTDAARQAMGECLRESMYALRFDEAPGVGRLTVTYPMVFSTEAGQTKGIPGDQLQPRFDVEGFDKTTD
jgi:hypothetical protein